MTSLKHRNALVLALSLLVAISAPAHSLADPLDIGDGGTATSSAVTNGVYYNNGTNAEADNSLLWSGVGGQLTVDGNELLAGTSVTSSQLQLAGTNNCDVVSPASCYGIAESTHFSPNPASTQKFIFGEYVEPTIYNYTGNSILSVSAFNTGVRLDSSATGFIHNFFDYEASDLINNTLPVNGVVNGPYELYQFFALGTNNGNGTTTGPVDNRDFFAAPSTAGAGLGGALSNYSFFEDVPTGSGAGTTNNYGLYLTDNGGTGGSGTTRNYAIYSNSTAPSYLGSQLALGSASVGSGLTVWGPDTASTSVLSIMNSASTPVFRVYDNGNATYSGSIFQYSDSRLKTAVTPLSASSSLAAILELTPVSYNRIDQPAQGTNDGFISQAVQKIFPNLVATAAATKLTPGGTLTLNYIGLIAPIVESIQALASEINGFSQSVHTQELCVGTTCIDQAQLQALLQASGQATTSPQ